MKCVPLTISYHLCFLCISKVSNMLHHMSMGWVHSKDKNAAFCIKNSFLWQSIKFLPQNINHSSETGNITVSITVRMSYFRKKHIYKRGVGGGGDVAEDIKFLNKMWKLKGPICRGNQEKIMWNFHEPWI